MSFETTVLLAQKGNHDDDPSVNVIADFKQDLTSGFSLPKLFESILKTFFRETYTQKYFLSIFRSCKV